MQYISSHTPKLLLRVCTFMKRGKQPSKHEAGLNHENNRCSLGQDFFSFGFFQHHRRFLSLLSFSPDSNLHFIMNHEDWERKGGQQLLFLYFCLGESFPTVFCHVCLPCKTAVKTLMQIPCAHIVACNKSLISVYTIKFRRNLDYRIKDAFWLFVV